MREVREKAEAIAAEVGCCTGDTGHTEADHNADIADAVEAALVDCKVTEEQYEAALEELEKEQRAREDAELLVWALAHKRGGVFWTLSKREGGWFLTAHFEHGCGSRMELYSLGNDPSGPVLTDEVREVLERVKQEGALG